VTTEPANPPSYDSETRSLANAARWERLRSVGTWLALAAVGLLIGWAFTSIQVDFSRFSVGFGKGMDTLSQMFPRSRSDWAYDRALLFSRDLITASEETIQMAIVGTVIGSIAALPISFLAARTGMLPRSFSTLIKTFLNIGRAVPTIVWALIAVSGFGLGVTAGAVAVSFVTFIGLGKLFAEALEGVAQGPVEAVRAVGGSPAQVFVYAMLPQVFPQYLSTTLYTFEYNVKDSFIVGIVGAGGLGQLLMQSFSYFKWLDAGAIIFVLVVLINLSDYGSYRLRLLLA
jgi:phosphonate transport system permease protein